ncbi:MAG: homoserine dehydrogenase [Lachnospiraceae bacterium]|jgi:homoserine dehydrogenase|nr:homoserine dehydrogenase [Lachnospiraceae bacterium]
MIAIGIIGYGTVGSGVYEVIQTNKESIAKRAGEEIIVKRICDLREFPGDPAEQLLTKDFKELAEDPEIRIIVETMGGVQPAYDYVKMALEHGKSVCTSNKELVARHGSELLAIAKERSLNFLFEASVGGGIPIIRPLNQALTADEIVEIKGILNGTTNYILTKMTREGAEYEDVLREAQEKGYAERNPEADVEGHDACRKIAILTSLAYGSQVDYEDIHTEGITHITKEDIAYAKAMDAGIKLLGSSKRQYAEGSCGMQESKIYAQVAPVLVKSDHPLYGVNDVFNAIFVKGNVLGEVMFYGRGAGKLPTASAVVSDVIDAVKHKNTNIMTLWSSKKLELGCFEDSSSRFFVRVPEAEQGQAQELFHAEGFQEVKAEGVTGEYAFLTGTLTEREYEKKTQALSVLNRIRVAF